MTEEKKLRLSLLLLRLGVAAVMIPWAVDKLVRPEHAGAVYEHFYGLSGVGAMPLVVIAVVELVIVAGFLVGVYRTWTYGLVLAMHAVSTLSSWRQYLDPFGEGPNLLFFAAWPMLAACIALFLLRDRDRLCTLGK